MTPEDDTAATETAQEQDDFASGFSDKPAAKTAKPAKPEPEAPPAEATTEAAEDKPEYVQVTAKELADIRAAAAKTASYDSQLSRVFGTLGNLQKLLNEQKASAQPAAPSAGRKIEIPKEAFAEMERDFPELAKMNRSALEAALSGMQVGEVDDGKLKTMLDNLASGREIEDLEDAYPDWRSIVGAVTKEQQPDPNHPFRKWLATKDEAYQAKVNGAEKAFVIRRAIRQFQADTKPAAATPKPAPEKPRETARADRFRAAVQPKGDGAAPAPGKSDNDEFETGFAHARG